MTTEMVLLCPHCGSDKVTEECANCHRWGCGHCGAHFEEPDEGAVVDPDSRWEDRRIEPREE